MVWASTLLPCIIKQHVGQVFLRTIQLVMNSGLTGRWMLIESGPQELVVGTVDLLYTPLVEPDALRFMIVPPSGFFPNVLEGDVEQTMRLCKVWGANRLLRLIPTPLGPQDNELFLHTKVFGNFKNADADRQIGDRRGRNYVEGRIEDGPSHDIPNCIASVGGQKIQAGGGWSHR